MCLLVFIGVNAFRNYSMIALINDMVVAWDVDFGLWTTELNWVLTKILQLKKFLKYCEFYLKEIG